jgi:ribosomal protein S18 acetylase RimI-like enzyme
MHTLRSNKNGQWLKMSTDIIVRDARADDLLTLVDFNIAMALETENKVLLRERVQPGVQALFLQPEYGFYLIAEVEAQIVGSLMITNEWSDWRNGMFWWVQSVYVKPDFRRRGVYRALYTAVKERAQKNPAVCGCRLYVEKDNLAAQETYRRLGMKELHYKMFEELFQAAA